MPRWKIDPKDINRVFSETSKRAKDSLMNALKKGAHKGKETLKEATPQDTMESSKAWKVKGSPKKNNLRIHNSSPYVGVLELGARPHGVNAEGRASIQAWVLRNLSSDEQEASRITQGIIEKIKREGQKGTFFIRLSIPEIGDELTKQITMGWKRVAKAPPR